MPKLDILKKIYRLNLLGRDLPIQERLFRMILVVGVFADTVALGETFFLLGFNSFIYPLSFLLVILIVALVLTIKYHYLTVAAIIVNIMLAIVVFPSMFFLNGGANGGACVWFVLSFVYTFMMFTGAKLVFFACLDVLAYICVYYIAYLNPDFVVPLGSKADIYIDSFFSVFVVGMVICALFKFQIKGYITERGLVEKQNKKLEETGKAKDVFFTSMSSELKSPITTILGLNEMIIREDEEQKVYDYTYKIQHAGSMLLNQINEILDYSKSELNQLEIINEEYSCAQMLENIIVMAQIQMNNINPNLNFEFEIDENIPGILIGDKRRIEQICNNLLSNAIKYTNEGYVKLVISVNEISKDKLSIIIKVSDTGIGIRSDNMDNLYSINNEIDGEQKSKGSGLGLAITKRIVDMLNGEITCDSNYMKGTVFTVSLEQGYVGDDTVGKLDVITHNYSRFMREYHPRFVAPKARILIVDENMMDTYVLRELLKSTKIKIDVVSTAKECLEMTLKYHYHVILLDDSMLYINEKETIKEIKRQKNSLCSESAIIAMTLDLTVEARAMYQQAGFNCYIEKPIDSNILEEYIYSFLTEDLLEYQSFHVFSDIAIPARKKIDRQKKRVIITTDSVAEISDKIAEKYDIGRIYMYIDTSIGRFEDTREIYAESLLVNMKKNPQGVIAESATIAEYENFFADNLEKAEYVIHISMAENMGKSQEIAKAAAKSFDHVRVVDSKQISCGQSIVVISAAKLASVGKSVDEICNAIEILSSHIETSFIIPDVNVFYSKGYTSMLIAKICNAISAKPIFKMRNSRLMFSGIALGDPDSAINSYLRMQLSRRKHVYKKYIMLTQVGLKKHSIEAIKDKIEEYISFDTKETLLTSCSSACNAGIGTFGMAFLVDIDKLDSSFLEDEMEIISDIS